MLIDLQKISGFVHPYTIIHVRQADPMGGRPCLHTKGAGFSGTTYNDLTPRPMIMLPPRKHCWSRHLFILVPFFLGCLCPTFRDSASEHSWWMRFWRLVDGCWLTLKDFLGCCGIWNPFFNAVLWDLQRDTIQNIILSGSWCDFTRISVPAIRIVDDGNLGHGRYPRLSGRS